MYVCMYVRMCVLKMELKETRSEGLRTVYLIEGRIYGPYTGFVGRWVEEMELVINFTPRPRKTGNRFQYPQLTVCSAGLNGTKNK
jgi:hypothetical protein